MDPSGRQLVFIIGHYKSGSTWLVNLLSLHPEIRALRETQLFQYAFRGPDLERGIDRLFSQPSWAEGGRKNLLRHRIGDWLRPLRRSGQATLSWRDRPTTLLDLSLRDQIALKRRLEASTTPEDLCHRFYSFLYAALRPASYLVDKSVTSLHYVSQIKRVFPECKLLAIHRDGRDVVVSDKFHLKNEYQQRQEFPTSVRRWREAMELQREHSREAEILDLSYEELLADGEAVVARLLGHLDLPRDAAAIADMLRRSSFEFVTGRPLGAEDPKAFYRKGGSGDWVNHFTEEHKREFSEIAGELLVELGYENAADWREWQGSERADPA